MKSITEFLENTDDLERFMGRALELAQQSLPNDIPIGALVVSLASGEIISEGYNTRQQTHDATHHAEVIAVQRACKKLSSKRLNEYALFTTLEPCIMCAGTLIQAHIGGVVFGADDPQYGAAGSIYNFFVDPRLSHNAPVVGGVLSEPCAAIVNDFFEKIRQQDHTDAS